MLGAEPLVVVKAGRDPRGREHDHRARVRGDDDTATADGKHRQLLICGCDHPSHGEREAYLILDDAAFRYPRRAGNVGS